MNGVPVIAGSYQQYKNFIRTHNMPHFEYVYVDSVEQLRGYVQGSILLCVGEYINSPVFRSLQDFKMINGRFIRIREDDLHGYTFD